MKDEEKEMSFLDHLEELRWHIIRALSAIVILMIAAFILNTWIFDHIIFAPARTDFPTFQWLCWVGTMTGFEDLLCIKEIPMRIQSRIMTGQFTMALTSSFVIGLTAAFPYVVWEIWRFIRPGLHKKERKYSRGAVAAISFLFFLGSAFGYYILSPLAIYFLSTYQVSEIVVNEFDITSYVSTVTTLILGSGILFQLPMVVYFLTQVGIITPAFLKQYRRHAIVIILIISAIITPPDPISQTIIGIPLLLLYEFSIFVSAMVMRRKVKRDAAEEAEESLNDW